MALAPTIESALRTGGILLVDELERELHPMLVNFIISKFQSKKSTPDGAQLVLTTHDTELMSMELFRKDQLYFADKDTADGSSELYSISEYSTLTTDISARDIWQASMVQLLILSLRRWSNAPPCQKGKAVHHLLRW